MKHYQLIRFWRVLRPLLVLILVGLSGVGCESDNSDSGNKSRGNCVDNARNIKVGMSAAQVIDIMGSPDSNKVSYDGSERQMIWHCGATGVLVDFQPGDRVFIVIADGVVIQQGSWSAQNGYSG